MPPDEADERYEDILARIAARRPFGGAKPEKPPAKRPHERVLDLVNAWDTLAELAAREYKSILCHGPRAFRGAAWSGVVIWARDKGYHGYQRIWLLGLWTQYRGDDILLSVGERELTYRAPVFDAGAYRHNIEVGFDLYYEDKGKPPGDGDKLLFETRFEASKRLELREKLQEIVNSWRARHDQ